MMKQYTPSELANLTGVTPRTIRYLSLIHI